MFFLFFFFDVNSRSEGMIEANIAYVPGWEATATRALQLGYKAVVVGATCRGDATDLQTLLPSRDVLRTSRAISRFAFSFCNPLSVSGHLG